MSDEMYVERQVNPKEQGLRNLLEEITSHMASGDYTASDAAILITRDEETGTVTFVFWGGIGDVNALFKKAIELKEQKVQ
jgi:hypothetical protein